MELSADLERGRVDGYPGGPNTTTRVLTHDRGEQETCRWRERPGIRECKWPWEAVTGKKQILS